MSAANRARVLEIFETDTVKEHIQEAASVCSKLAHDYLLGFYRGAGPYMSKCESPIEAVFWVWWYAFDWMDRAIRFNDVQIYLESQVDVTVSSGNRYRFDFALTPLKVGIELDGHDFHERTKDQVIKRNVRDRELQMDGWQVFHFSGTELLRQPADCIRTVFEFCLERDEANQRAAELMKVTAAELTKVTTAHDPLKA